MGIKVEILAINCPSAVTIMWHLPDYKNKEKQLICDVCNA